MNIPFLMSLSNFLPEVYTVFDGVSPSSSLYHSEQDLLLAMMIFEGMSESQSEMSKLHTCFLSRFFLSFFQTWVIFYNTQRHSVPRNPIIYACILP